MYINKVTIYGNLTKNPELKSLPSGTHIINFSVATNRTWFDKDKTKKEEVEYHNVVAFGKQAETINTYIKKGDGIYLEGRLSTRSWEDTNGNKRYSTEIILEEFQFGARKSGEVKKETKQEDTVDSFAKDMENSVSDEVEYPNEDINPEDIPF